MAQRIKRPATKPDDVLSRTHTAEGRVFMHVEVHAQPNTPIYINKTQFQRSAEVTGYRENAERRSRKIMSKERRILKGKRRSCFSEFGTELCSEFFYSVVFILVQTVCWVFVGLFVLFFV